MSDVSNKGSLGAILKTALKSWLLDVDDMLPAKVVSYDEKSNRATIQPIVVMVTEDNARVSRAPLPNIPVFRFGGGDFFIRFPIKSGDAGWIKANDRDISLIFQRGWQEDQANTKRLHSFSDALFIPDVVRSWVIDDKNKDAVVMQSLDGKSCLSVHKDKIELETENIKLICENFELETKTYKLTAESIETNSTSIKTTSVSNEMTSAQMQITAPNLGIASNTLSVGQGSVDIDAPVTMQQSLDVKQNVDTHAAITSRGKDISSTHTHEGIEEGGGTSGEVT